MGAHYASRAAARNLLSRGPSPPAGSRSLEGKPFPDGAPEDAEPIARPVIGVPDALAGAGEPGAGLRIAKIVGVADGEAELGRVLHDHPVQAVIVIAE